MESPKIKPSYSIWRHPIRWFRERKMRLIMQIYLDKKWPEMEPEIAKAKMDIFLYGNVLMKDGKVIPPTYKP